jgi:hypothetical protein
MTQTGLYDDDVVVTGASGANDVPDDDFEELDDTGDDDLGFTAETDVDPPFEDDDEDFTDDGDDVPNDDDGYVDDDEDPFDEDDDADDDALDESAD